MIRAATIVALLAGCSPKVVELGTPDAPPDTSASDDSGSSCRCRITPCRVPGDCALIGGACGPDFFCVGDFGACTTTTQCQTTVTDSKCTVSATSTVVCP
jgi:hypothetical protein